ncbi:MAG TPA: septum formation initiator family protein [Bacteroidales bacterium]|nr:septum formation initiator family protein [Bacteroidales bacterium]
MNEFLTKFYHKLPPFLRNKYILTIILFLIWVILFDNNNLIDRYHDLKNLKQLEKDKEYYLNRIEEDTRKLNELKTSDETLEKFAREQYHMKKDDEDIYIIVTEKEERVKKKDRR